MLSNRQASPTSASSPSPSKNESSESSEDRVIATQLQYSRDERTEDKLGGNIVGSLVLHALVVAVILGWAYIFRAHTPPWGENASSAGAIQATMVASIPLPPKQRDLDTGVLTSETPSPAPLIAKEQTVPPPDLKAVPIPTKAVKPPKVAPKETPQPPKHVQPTPPQPKKAATGDTGGIRIPEATMQLKNGSASVSMQDRAFGARFAYYVNIVNRTVAQNWFTQEADPVASNGKSVTIVFDIDREGTPSNARVETRSGSPSLDTSALRALQRVNGFGPLPQGDHITVEYTFNYKKQ
jgi:protein TonB